MRKKIEKSQDPAEDDPELREIKIIRNIIMHTENINKVSSQAFVKKIKNINKRLSERLIEIKSLGTDNS